VNPIAAALRANPALSDAAIAAICGVKRQRVQAMRKRLGIPAAKRGRPLVAVRCPVCDAAGAGSTWLTQHRRDSPNCNRRRLCATWLNRSRSQSE
jgi:hypothetical protein